VVDITKKVVTKYTIDDRQAISRAKALQRRMDSIGNAARKVTGKLGGLFKSVAAPLGLLGGAGLVAATKGIFDMGRAAQDAELQLTGLLQGVSKSSNLPLKGFAAARATAADLRQEFIKLARDSPIAAEDVREAFAVAAFPLTRAGLSLQKQANLARSTAIADLSNAMKGTAARDVQQILAGRGGQQITTDLLRPIANEAAKLAKTGKIAEAAALIQKQLTPDPDLLKAYGNSATGMIATLGDQIKQLGETAAKPLLEFLVKKTKEWGKWLENNRDKVKKIAKQVGRTLVKGIKAVIKAVRFLAENWKTILTIVKVLVGVWILGKMVSGITTVVRLASRLGTVLSKAGAAIGGKGALGKLARAGGYVGAAVVAATEGEAVGEAAAGLFISEKQKKALERQAGIQFLGKRAPTLEEVRAARAERKKTLEEELDPTKVAMKARGGRGRKVKRMIVERFEVRDKRFRRFSTPFVVGVRRESRAQRQVVGLGLGVGAVGVRP
jgi:hypothetical protein